MTEMERIIQVIEDQLKLCGPDPEKDRNWVTFTADDARMISAWLKVKQTQCKFVKVHCVGCGKTYAILEGSDPLKYCSNCGTKLS